MLLLLLLLLLETGTHPLHQQQLHTPYPPAVTKMSVVATQNGPYRSGLVMVTDMKSGLRGPRKELPTRHTTSCSNRVGAAGGGKVAGRAMRACCDSGAAMAISWRLLLLLLHDACSNMGAAE
jgi:hypothetical protein